MTYHCALPDPELSTPVSFAADEPRSTRRLARDLSALAAGMDARFVAAGTTLMSAIETIDRLIGILKGISGALDGDAVDEAVATLTGMADLLTDLPDKLVLREGDLQTANTNSAKLGNRVEEVQNLFNVLEIYGLNTKIAAEGQEDFVRFVYDIGCRIGDGRSDLVEISETLRDLTPRLTDANRLIEPLRRECARIVPEVPELLAKNALLLRDHMQEMGDLAGSVLTIAQQIQGEVALVLGALQVGDSTRQRIEHVVEALEILDGHVAAMGSDRGTVHAVEAHIHTLLADQLDATARDFTAGSTTLLKSLHGIGPHTARLLSLMESQASTGRSTAKERTLLTEVEHNISEMEGLTNRLHETDQQSNLLMIAVAEALVQLGLKLKVFADLRIDVRNIAMNMLVLCRRMGDTGRAVFVIAKEIDRLCVDLGAALDGMIELVADLSKVGPSIRATTTLESRPDLADALAIIGQGCSGNESRIEQGRIEAAELIELLDRIDTELAEELSLERQMMAASDFLSATSPESTDEGGAALTPEALSMISAILSDIARRYSMAQEREIHSRHVPPGAESETVRADDFDLTFEADCDDEDDDDGLF